MNNKKYYSWILYDWANSAYATIVLAGFYPIIFSEYFASLLNDAERTFYLGLSNSMASLILIILAPLLGLLADKNNSRKKLLIITAFLGIFSTLFLALVAEDRWVISSLLFSISMLGFMLSNVFYDSMLTSFEKYSDYNAISSYGYAIGYLGGGIAFILALVFLFFYNAMPLEIIQNKKIVFVFASLWWLIFMIPLILFWKDSKSNINKNNITLYDTYIKIKNNKKLLYFLLSYWIYIDGVDTIMRMAVNYGITIGFTSNHLLIALLLIQFISFPGTLLMNVIARVYSIQFSITLCLSIYLIVTILSYSLTTVYEFYFIAILIGLAQGGIQALSRSYYAILIPKSQSSEYFGIYNMLGKFAALLGPLLVGIVTILSDNSRLGMLSISIFFIIGIYLFNKQRQISI